MHGGEQAARLMVPGSRPGHRSGTRHTTNVVESVRHHKVKPRIDTQGFGLTDPTCTSCQNDARSEKEQRAQQQQDAILHNNEG